MGSVKVHLLLLWVCMLSCGLFSQSTESANELLDALQAENDPKSKITLYDHLADYYLTRNPDSALFYIETGLQQSQEIEYSLGNAEMIANLGDYHIMQDKLYEAKENYEQASKLFEAIGEIGKLAEIYLVLGNIYWVQDNYVYALDYYTRGERIADSLSLITLLPDFHNNLGTVYFEMEDFEQSQTYYLSAIALFRQTNNLNQLPVSMINVGKVNLKLNKLEKARQMCFQVLKITDSIPESGYAKVLAWEELGNIEFTLDNYQFASDYYSQALRIMYDLPAGYRGPRSATNAFLLLQKGRCLYELGRYDSAMSLLNEAYSLGLNNGQLSVVMNASSTISLLYNKLGNTEKALEYLRVSSDLSDSISNEKTTKKITQIKMKYEFDKTLRVKELERITREEAQKRTELILFIVIGSILSALVLLFLLLRLQKNKTRRVELEQKNLRLDLNYKNKELTTNVMYLLKKNEFILTISDKLTKMRDKFKAENREVIDDVIREIENSSKEVNWKDFELRFQEVHSEFYERLNKRYPDLTPNELKICAFLRLNMTTKEISSITYQSYNSIIMARHRLRKKLNMESAENLVAFLQGL